MARPQLVEAQRRIVVGDPMDQGRRAALAAGSNGGGVTQWEAPAEFCRHDLPHFPVEALPEALRDFATSASTEYQVPVDLPSMVALGIAAGAYAGNVEVSVRGNWRESTSLASVVVMNSGERKSAVIGVAVAPLEEIEREEQIAMREVIAKAQSERRILEERKVRLEKEAGKADNPVERNEKKAEAQKVAAELVGRTEPISPERIGSDITPEQTGSKLADHRRYCIVSPEGEFFSSFTRYSKDGQPHFETALKATAGDAIRISRRGLHEYVRRPALTIVLTVQPDVIRAAGENKALRGRGFLGRIHWSMPASMLGRRQIAATPMYQEVRDRYDHTIKALAKIEPALDREGDPIGRPLYVTSEANELLKEFESEIESRLGDDGDLATITDWAGKLCGGVVRISAVLWLVENADRLTPWPDKISADCMSRAITIGRYLIQHAKAAFAEMGADPNVENAKRLLRWIERDRVKAFTRRDAHQAHRARFKTVDEIDPVLDLLESHNYIRPQLQMDQETRRGRKASQPYEVNPHVLARSIESIEAEAIQAEGCGA